MVVSNDALYQPTNAEESAVFRFRDLVNSKHHSSLTSYADLYHWSTNNLDHFWDLVWDATGVIGDKGSHVVDVDARPNDNPAWFSGAKLNWAENMLRERSHEKIALIQATEPTQDLPDPLLRKVSYASLYETVANVASALLLHGLKPGDRVGAYCSNCIENVAACLATTALGGIWVSAAADFGPDGVLERFEQVQPKFIFAVDAVVYNAKVHPHLPKVTRLVAELSKKDLAPKVIIIHAIPQAAEHVGWSDDWVSWESYVEEGRVTKLGRAASGEIEWHRTTFDWPLWILFSSGTTGRPKPIVHRVGGMLLQLKKELMICGDIRPNDVFFYYTTTGWMMWNFLVSGLTIGCTLVLYDGSPLRDPGYLWKLTDELGISIFGTSAKYIDQLSKNYIPREKHSLRTLRHIYSTGSPLAPALYDYVYEKIHPNVLLGSITGMAVESFSPSGESNPPGENGELVCVKPFPCMPLGFWPLPGFGDEAAVKAAQTRFQQSYFSEFSGVWYHGDHIVITESRGDNAGGMVMLGRSDGVLNPGGVRFGSAELYDVIETCFSEATARDASHVIVDSVAVGQSIDGGTDERVALFVKLPDGHKLSEELEKDIRGAVRSRRSPRHVPSKILQVQDIPYTLNSKRVEVPVKKANNKRCIRVHHQPSHATES
ncbi:hypothetical protein ONZ45_g8488 [Pleurotus djamor]|nr:hypothetical protein ONZ45_g8488 [Pleurotus djamor]